MQIDSSLANILTPTAIALGNFDGIHRGHLEVIRPVLADRSGACKTVVSFDPHPQQYFTGQQRQLLTPHQEREIVLEQLGIEQLILLPFDRDLVKLSPQEFVSQIVDRQLQAKFISVGEDFRFGAKRAGGYAMLDAAGRTAGFDVARMNSMKYKVLGFPARPSGRH